MSASMAVLTGLGELAVTLFLGLYLFCKMSLFISAPSQSRGVRTSHFNTFTEFPKCIKECCV
jgi:hypothetical protein